MADETNLNLYNILTGVIKVDQTQNAKITALTNLMTDHKAENDATFGAISGELKAASGFLSGKIDDAVKAAQDNLVATSGQIKLDYIAYADQAELDAIASAKTYTDAEVKALSTSISGTVDGIAAGLSKAITDNKAAATAEVEALSASISGTVDGIIAKVDGDIEYVSGIVDSNKEAIEEALADAEKDLTAALTLSGVNATVVDYSKNEVSLKINGNDKVLSQDANGLSASIQLVKLAEALSSTYAASYQLQGLDGAVLGDAINIPKDQLLKDAKFVNGTNGNDQLELTFIVADGSEKVVDISLSGIIDDFSGASGVVREGWTFRGVVDGNSEDFLTVGEKGFKLTGVQEAINTAAVSALTDANAYTDTEVKALSTSISGTVDAINDTLTAAINTAATTAQTNLETASGNLQRYADQAEADALSAANAYTDIASGALNGRLTTVEQFVGVNAQGGQSLADKVTFISGAIGEGFSSEATVKAYVDQAEADAITSANNYTDAEITAYDLKFADLADDVAALLTATAAL